MDADQRLLQLRAGAGAGSAPFFELREDDAERAFHLSIRLAAGRFVINDMQGGHWGAEDWHDLPPGFGAEDPILLDRRGRQVRILIGGGAVEWMIRAPGFGARGFHVHTEGIDQTWIAPRRHAGLGAGPRLERLAVAGCDLAVPPGADPGVVLRQQALAWRHEQGWLDALVLVPGPDAALPPADPPLMALAAAGFRPGRRVTAPCPDALTAQTLNAVAAFNGIDGFQALPPDAEPPTPAPVLPARPRITTAPAPAEAPGLEVIVALYNTEDHIGDCLDSLLAGLDPTDTSVGITVVDDGSTDAGPERVRARYGGDPRLRIVSKPNGGCASARNFGRRLARRSHIAFVDADDLVDQGFFPALLAVARETGADVVQGGFARFEGDDPTRRWPAPADPQPDPVADRLVCGLMARPVSAGALNRRQAAIWRRVYRRGFLDEQDIWFPESATAFDDLGFEQRLLSALDRMWMVFGPQYLYRQHPQQDVRQGDARHFNSLHQMRLMLDHPGGEVPDGELVPVLIANAAWSVTLLEPALLDPFLVTLAELIARCHARDPARDWPGRARSAIAHPDFAYHLDRALAGPCILAPVADHPDRLRLLRGCESLSR